MVYNYLCTEFKFEFRYILLEKTIVKGGSIESFEENFVIHKTSISIYF